MAARIAEFYCSELGTTLIVYSDGEIWEEHGSKEIAKIYKDGQIWAYGKHIANYDSSNGQLWDSTNSTKICTIYSDGDVYDELGRLGKVYSNNDDSDDYRRSSSNSYNDDNDYNDYGRSSYNYNESSRYDSGSSAVKKTVTSTASTVKKAATTTKNAVVSASKEFRSDWKSGIGQLSTLEKTQLIFKFYYSTIRTEKNVRK